MSSPRVWLFTEIPESSMFDDEGNLIGISSEGVEVALDLSCSVSNVTIEPIE